MCLLAQVQQLLLLQLSGCLALGSGTMTQLYCNPRCPKGAYPDGHPLRGFCCGRCVFTIFSWADFDLVGRSHYWYQPKKNGHYKHCKNPTPTPTEERAERPLLTAALADEMVAFLNNPHKPPTGPGSSSRPSSSSLRWELASHARLLQTSENTPANVFPMRHVNYIFNMPLVIISLTYEGSDGRPWRGFKNYRWMRFYGRAAKLWPPCELRSAVSDGIRDILGFMANTQWDADTRFLFLEEDWRPHADDDWDPVPAKDVIDCLVQITIAAATHEIGDFVWLSWEQNKTPNNGKREVFPEFGNLCQVYTVGFAKRLLEHVLQSNPTGQHWDVYLMQYLMANPHGTCWCKPSLGGYYNHFSGCEERFGKKMRICDWRAFWRAQYPPGALSEVQLQSFKKGLATEQAVTHRLHCKRTGLLQWQHQLRKRTSEEARLSEGSGATLPAPSDPEDESIFAAPPPVGWTLGIAQRFFRKSKGSHGLGPPPFHGVCGYCFVLF